MGEMQENFQHKLGSMRNISCVVCSERWYTDGEGLDPALYERVNVPLKKKMHGDMNSLLEDYKTFQLGHCATVPLLHDSTHFGLSVPYKGERKQTNREHSFYKKKITERGA